MNITTFFLPGKSETDMEIGIPKHWNMQIFTEKRQSGICIVELGRFLCSLLQKAKFVRGVEIVPAAIEDAKRNAQINHIENVEFFVGKQEEFCQREYEKNGVYGGCDRC